MPDLPVLLLVDGHNLLWRAAFGTPATIHSRDRVDPVDLTAQFMFFALLRKTINTDLPSWPEILVVFDGQYGSGERQTIDAGYKANRAQDAEALKPILALPHIKQGLDLYGITWIEVDDAEADDVIATLTTQNPGRDILILSTDQDYYQLLHDPEPATSRDLIGRRRPVHVLNPLKRPDQRLIGPTQVHAIHGVSPDQFADYRALCGDTSDNIPGVRGIGSKTAAALLTGGLHLEDLPASGRLTGAKGTAITDTWPQVLTWRSMIHMRTDLPLPSGPTGVTTTPLPIPGDVIAKLGLWTRPPAPATARPSR